MKRLFSKKTVEAPNPVPQAGSINILPKRITDLAGCGAHLYPEKFQPQEKIVHFYSTFHGPDKYSPRVEYGYVAHIDTEDPYINRSLMGDTGAPFKIGKDYTAHRDLLHSPEHRHLAAAAMRYTLTSGPANHYLNGKMLVGDDTNVVASDLNTLSHGLRHPALTLQNDAKTIMHVTSAYDHTSPLEKIREAKVGQKFTTNRFMSTTTNPGKFFVANFKVHFHLPAGYNKGVWVAPVSYHPQ